MALIVQTFHIEQVRDAINSKSIVLGRTKRSFILRAGAAGPLKDRPRAVWVREQTCETIILIGMDLTPIN